MIQCNKKTEKRKEKLRMQLSCLVYRKLKTYLKTENTTTSFVNYKKGALDSQPQVIKFTSCLPMVGGYLRVLRLPPPLKVIAMI
jgi:hypothetical protein